MAQRAVRRLAAILAVDVVGYSRLVGADEMGTIARVKAHRVDIAQPLIAEYRGRVVKFTGDGALVEFESAVDAVECAVAIQQGIAAREADGPEERRIRYRIGINIGDVVHEDGDIFGDGVNVAVRLEGVAEPGGICIARNVYEQVKSKLAIGFAPIGPRRVKNIAEPIEIWRVGPGPGVALPDRYRLPAQRRWQVATATVGLLLALGAGAWYGLGAPAQSSSTAAVAGMVSR
jgi:adenylate cyclase